MTIIPLNWNIKKCVLNLCNVVYWYYTYQPPEVCWIYSSNCFLVFFLLSSQENTKLLQFWTWIEYICSQVFKKRLEAKRDCIASILLFKRIAVYAHYTWWNFRRCDILEKSNATRHLWMFFFSHLKSSYFKLHFAHNIILLIK